MKRMDCHTGNPLVFTASGIDVYAGGVNRNGGWHRMSPMPDVAIGPIGVIETSRTRDVMPDGWSCSDKLDTSTTPIIIEIDWPDYNIPSNLGKDWWLAFIDDIKSKGIKSVSTQCMGGHGRTGVQVAILRYYLTPVAERKWADAHVLIQDVRSLFCNHLVEAQVQQQYIADVCGIPVGKSAISHTKANDMWAGLYDNDTMDIEELLRKEEERERQEKKDKKAKKPKKHGALDNASKVKSGKVKDWTLTYCADSDTYEWHRVSLDLYSNESIMFIDDELYGDEYRTIQCLDTDMMFHPTEMIPDTDVSKLVHIQHHEQEYRKKWDSVDVKYKGKWYPISFMLVENPDLPAIPMSAIGEESE
jgi:hypothetical protein